MEKCDDHSQGIDLKQVGKETFVTSQPVPELSMIQSKAITVDNLQVGQRFDLSGKIGRMKLPCLLRFSLEKINDFSLVLSNDSNQKLIIGYDKKSNQYFIDRTSSGKVDFQKDFAAKHTAPRMTDNQQMNISIILDESSAELFADDGLTVMTEIFFPDTPYSEAILKQLTGYY